MIISRERRWCLGNSKTNLLTKEDTKTSKKGPGDDSVLCGKTLTLFCPMGVPDTSGFDPWILFVMKYKINGKWRSRSTEHVNCWKHYRTPEGRGRMKTTSHILSIYQSFFLRPSLLNTFSLRYSPFETGVVTVTDKYVSGRKIPKDIL